METAQLFSSILGECTSYQIAGTLTKDGSSTITEEIAESLLRVSPPADSVELMCREAACALASLVPCAGICWHCTRVSVSLAHWPG